MKDIKSMTLAELGAELKALGEPAFRAKQIYRWMHRGVRDFSEMTDISRSLRERLAAEYTLVSPTVARRLQSQKDGTIKYLWRLMDGNCVESVLMRYHYGNTICISSEVGCRMGCAFCASTRGGLVRRLEPSEMLDQVLFSQLGFRPAHLAHRARWASASRWIIMTTCAASSSSSIRPRG